MQKTFILLALAAFAQAAGAQQLPNGSFDGTWENCYPWEKGAKVSTAYGTQPEGWCISNVPNSLMPTVGSEITGADGTGKAVKLSNVSVLGQSAPGYISLGTTWATAETKGTTVRNADGGVFGGIAFAWHPDAVRLTYMSDRSKGSENISIIAYLWKGTWTQQNVPSNTAVGLFSYGTATKVTMTDRIQNILGKSCNTGGTITKTDDAELVASVEYYSNAAVDSWTTREFPLEYKSTATPEKLNIVIASNGLFDDRSTIKSDNSVSVDDVELVYWHALSSLSYAGATLDFDESVTSYDLSSVGYDETKLSYTVKGQAAVATKSYDEETRVLTIRIEGEDIVSTPDSFTEYTIQFGEETGPQVVSTKGYPEDLYVSIDGEVSDKQVADVQVETLEDGNINFVLKNFVLGGDDGLPVGNIEVSNLEVDADGNFAFVGGIQLLAGDNPAYSEEDWMGPGITMMAGGSVPLDLTGRFITEDRLVVYISIDLTSTFGYGVDVYLGYARAMMTVSAEAQYGTFCAPFPVGIPAGVEACTVGSVADGILQLEALSETVPANTPVVLCAEGGLEAVDFFGIAEEGTPAAGMLTGVYESTLAPVGSYVLQSIDGRVGFYQVAEGMQPVVGANRCYLTASSEAKAFFLDASDATGIKALSDTPLKGGSIYNLAGQRMSKIQSGINIINGKKTLK